MIRILILVLSLLASPVLANDVNCLAVTIYHESRGEPLAGQYAVAYVVLNRTEDENFPHTICEVVRQKGQFGGYKPKAKIKDKKAWEQANRVAITAMKMHEAGFDTTNGALYFNTGKKGLKIGNHGFY